MFVGESGHRVFLVGESRLGLVVVGLHLVNLFNNIKANLKSAVEKERQFLFKEQPQKDVLYSMNQLISHLLRT